MHVINKLQVFLVFFVGSETSRTPTCTGYHEVLWCSEVICELINSRESDFCKNIVCDGIQKTDCKDGAVFEEKLTMCGCCSGCIKYKDIGEPCDVNQQQPPSQDPNCVDEYCPMITNKRKPRLSCNFLGSSSRICMPNSTTPILQTCEYKRSHALTGRLHWTPECESDGKFYSPKQCKGEYHDGTCFCVDPDGNRIFGRQWWKLADNQACQCSRQLHKMRAKDGYIATLHCSSEGNYEPLQCDTDSGLCYCVDPINGKLTGALVPEDKWHLLPCYSPVDHTDIDRDASGQYLRRCESSWATGEAIRREGVLHGVKVYSGPDSVCDYDGSFWNKRREKSNEHCVPKTGQFDGSGGNLQQLGSRPMNCQCFRDAILYSEEGRTMSMLCDRDHATGNYHMTSPTNSTSSAYRSVDKDGFFMGTQ